MVSAMAVARLTMRKARHQRGSGLHYSHREFSSDHPQCLNDLLRKAYVCRLLLVEVGIVLLAAVTPINRVRLDAIALRIVPVLRHAKSP